MKYIVTLNGNSYEVEVEQGQATANYIGKAEEVKVMPVAEEKPTEVTKAEPVLKGDGEAVRAPMPGNILKVNVSEGSSVKAGDILFILEAMKMENEIVAPKNGTITSVSVKTGDTVATDAVLATIK